VRRLQEIVLPLVEREDAEEEASEVGWQSKTERRMLKIESSLDAARKEWQLGVEKQLMRLEEQL
jgi:hypothetical protein